MFQPGFGRDYPCAEPATKYYSMPDPVTHLSIGYIVARHCYKDHKILFLSSTIILDIDGLTGLIYIFLFLPSGSSPDEIARVFQLFHPSLTASLFFIPFFVYIVLIAFRLVNRKLVPQSTSKAYGLILLAMLIHLGLDMLMTGNRPFWPLALEAGLPVIPYTVWGTIVPMVVALTLLVGDLFFFRDK